MTRNFGKHMAGGFAALLLLAGPLRAQQWSVALVQGTGSTPNKAEKGYAQTVTRNLGRWLSEAGVPFTLVDDERVEAGALASARVAILGYNPNPGSRELTALRRFVDGGGKLIVCYSASPELAELMEVRLGAYASAPIGQWSAMRFNRDAPEFFPSLIRQDSANIRPVAPVRGRSKVVANWQTAAGAVLADPAVVQSTKGFWVTHVLLNDTDSQGKMRLLVAMLGLYEPAVWRAAAGQYVRASRTFRSYGTFPAVVEALRKQAEAQGRGRQVEPCLGQAASAYAELSELYKSGDYPRAVERSLALKAMMVHAYATAIPSRANEFRGVWDHAGVGLYRGNWEKTCRVLADAGMTDIMSNMLWPWMAHYRSGVLEESGSVRMYGDQVEQALGAAHRHGLKLHVWKVCWRVDDAPPAFMSRMRREKRLQVTDKGETIEWLCPSDPANIWMELSGIKEVANRYAIDGIHLDYIRYRDMHGCYCAGCRKRFERDLGRGVGAWPAGVLSGPLKQQYNNWRKLQITSFVRRAAEETRAVNPKARVSAAVYGKYPQCGESIAQDWGTWLQKGYVDFVCPMDYTNSLSRFTDYVRDQMALPKAKGRIYPGIGVTATESDLGPVDVLDQITALRREGADGFILFDLDRTLEHDILPVLRLGATAER